MVDHEIDVALRLTQIVVEADCVCIEIQEVEVAILFEARHRREAVGLAIEARSIGVFARHGFQRAVRVEGPAVIHAVEAACVALPFAADKGAAMTAHIEQRVRLAVGVAGKQDGATGNLARAEIARIGDFRGMAHIDPAGVEDLAPFLLEDVVGNKDFAVDQKRVFVRVLKHIWRVACRVLGGISHVASSLERSADVSGRPNSTMTNIIR